MWHERRRLVTISFKIYNQRTKTQRVWSSDKHWARIARDLWERDIVSEIARAEASLAEISERTLEALRHKDWVDRQLHNLAAWRAEHLEAATKAANKPKTKKKIAKK